MPKFKHQGTLKLVHNASLDLVFLLDYYHYYLFSFQFIQKASKGEY